MSTPSDFRPNSSHWGAFLARDTSDGIQIAPPPDDPNPSPILGNIPDAIRHRARIAQPMVRRGWLEHGPGPTTSRGDEPFVAVSWDEGIALAARALRETYASPEGARSVFGGSYGWSSAGRFNHAQSQVHRFLNTLGGYVASRNTYSSAAAEVILERVVDNWRNITNGVTWPDIVEHTELVVSFGGMAPKNMSVAPGGISRHVVPNHMRDAHARGCRFALISPLTDDLPDDVEAEQIAIRPGTDVALMLAIAFTLIEEDLVDHAFLERCTVGYARFARYVTGAVDAHPKTPDWAEDITGVPARVIVDLARRMARSRTLVAVAYSLQRAEHGEQPVWMALTLSAMLGQFGMPGAGFTFALGAMGHIGRPRLEMKLPSLPQGRNAVSDFIPVARISDLLLRPGEPFDYDGLSLVYPKVSLVYWAGGNPFHHHQDLNRLRRALGTPHTIIVHEPFWTPMARHADIVFPATTTLEREDIGAGFNDEQLWAMHRIVDPVGQAKDDFKIFRLLAAELGVEQEFTEGRTARQWLQKMYEDARPVVAAEGIEWPSFDDFWARGRVPLPVSPDHSNAYSAFRVDPEGAPLTTPSGKIEIFSETIDSFGYDDCPGHPTWFPLTDTNASATAYPLRLVANQPATRLHSQLDVGATSVASKILGREPVRIHPTDAAERGIEDGTIVRLFSAHGACLGGARLSTRVMPGVVQLSTGAWFDPDESGMCVHGNPNVLIGDVGTSRLAQGCTGQLALVDVERFDGPVPAIRAHEPPEIMPRNAPIH